MEEIKETAVRMQVEYVLVWVVTLVIALVFECGILDEGALVGNPRVEFLFETVEIQFTLAIIPLSLKYFGRTLPKWRVLPLKAALQAYHKTAVVRLFLLAFAVWGNLLLYYITLNNIGGLCALIAGIAILFCVPGKKRIMNELDLEGL